MEFSEKKVTDFNINRKIFVGNVSYRIKSRQLSKFFSKFGPVEYCYIVKDHIRKWSKGIAFVTFSDEESMKKALEAEEDQLYLDQRQMRVKPAELSAKATYWQPQSDSSSDTDDDHEDQNLGNQQQHPEFQKCQDVQGDSTCYIDSLFNELLLRIFSLLSWKERVGIERVCWRWKHVVGKSWVWQKHLQFQEIFRRFEGLTDKMLNSLLVRCGQYLESLDLSSSPRHLTDFAMDIIGKHSPGIMELDLSNVKITDVSVKNLMACCTNLHFVRLKRCLHITDKGISTLLSAGQPLQCLDVSDLTYLSGHCFKGIHSDMDTLRILVLTDCFKMQDSGFINMVKHCRHLEELYINNCRNLTSASIWNLCSNCLRLRILQAAGIKVETSCLHELGSLADLEDLNISLCQSLTDAVLASVSDGCKKLRVLDISGCHAVTDIGVMSLAKLPELESLCLSYLNQVTEDSVIKLAHAGHLKKFVARATKFTTDDALLTLASLCPNLLHVDLSGCFQVTNRIFEGFKETVHDGPEKTVSLVLGGTSVDWLADDVDWLSGVSHLNVSMHNMAMEELRADRDLVLPSYNEEENWDDEAEEYPPHPPLSAFLQEPEEEFDAWEEDYCSDEDEFLYNDDALEYEQWNMS